MEIIIGIDFGTTNTVISYFENNKTNILMDGVYKSIKSKVAIKDDKYSCGNYINLNYDKIYQSFKSDIGKIDMNEILLVFFNHLKKIIYNKFPNYILKTVITVPSNFNDIQREIIRNNFINNDFDVIRIINEPSAAALAYGLNLSGKDEEEILVLDLGGGTLDLTILLKDNNFFEILHSTGLNDLGGDNFTRIIYDYIIKSYPTNETIKLFNICQNAKEKLSYLDNYLIKINDYEFLLDRYKFENLCSDLIKRIEELLTDIKNNYNIKYVIMVGNTSKIPFIKNICENIFNIKPWIHPNLDTVVAEGACLYGAILEKKYNTDNNVVLVDVLPLSLGIETIDGNFSIIVPKNTPLPVKRSQKYTTDDPSENSVKIKVYQGERLIANKNTLIGEFIFNHVSLGGTPVIDITFKIDTNSIISITITDKKSGFEKDILIKDLPKLNSTEIENIINIAETNNKIDEYENTKQSRIYLLNTKIEIAMNNIYNNFLLDDKTKNQLLQDLTDIDSKIENSDNMTLLKLLNELETNFEIWLQNNMEVSDNNDGYDEMERIMILQLKDELYNKIIFIKNKNPEWNEYLDPIIDKLSLANITLEYIQQQLEILKELEEEEVISFYDQLKNLCVYIKSQIEQELIELSQDKINLLSDLVNKTLEIIENNIEDMDWEIELNNFNEQCQIIHDN